MDGGAQGKEEYEPGDYSTVEYKIRSICLPYTRVLGCCCKLRDFLFRCDREWTQLSGSFRILSSFFQEFKTSGCQVSVKMSRPSEEEDGGKIKDNFT